MHIAAIKTPKITSGAMSLHELLDAYLSEFRDKNILAVTSKVVALCEGNTVPIEAADKETLVADECDYYLPAARSKYGHHFTITNDTLVAMAGIDESNTDGQYVLWPRNAQATANNTRQYLRDRFGVSHAGVIITDSTCQPLRRGTTGISLAHSGFAALHDYVGQPDLFGRSMRVTQSSVSGGLAAAATVCMGEGPEQTPLVLISDAGFVSFQDREPAPGELAGLRITPADDLFAPFLESATWQNGRRHKRRGAAVLK